MNDPLFKMGVDKQDRNYRYHYRKTALYAFRQLGRKSATLRKACLAVLKDLSAAVRLPRYRNRRDHANRH